jgi:hypothetical protein
MWKNLEKIPRLSLESRDKPYYILISTSHYIERNELLKVCVFGGLGVDHLSAWPEFLLKYLAYKWELDEGHEY